jgi:hypothetical protein
MQAAIIERRTVVRTVSWAAAQASSPIAIDGHVNRLRLELPAAFVGTTLTYQVRNAAGDWIPVHVGGVAVSDTVAGATASLNVLSANLTGIPEFRIVSDQAETCTGRLLATS